MQILMLWPRELKLLVVSSRHFDESAFAQCFGRHSPSLDMGWQLGLADLPIFFKDVGEVGRQPSMGEQQSCFTISSTAAFDQFCELTNTVMPSMMTSLLWQWT